MQTFLPHADFERSAAVLDRQRLGKQRVENLQIMNVLMGHKTGGWINHPAVRMWRGFEVALLEYQDAVCWEWSQVRGYKDTCLASTLGSIGFSKVEWNSGLVMPIYPGWLGDEAFHASHRSNLLRKDREYYSQFGWTESDDLPYTWPV